MFEETKGYLYNNGLISLLLMLLLEKFFILLIQVRNVGFSDTSY
jgi:hypothetical protein